ncbi:phosphatase [Vibrio viridaestus]|uniref:Phosphatase n=1 Tax=Vibrio viridaestus TaxID=2487322 RepID=A0A3N9TEY2_9VIBR|nr:phosphatase [Vibrio viridaestus]RQW62679.1 phosphatase [Vibrio viridaestus]
MHLVVDTHTHTYASGHAYSTIIENARAAKEQGLSILCTTDHADSMPGAPHYWFFANQKILPRFLDGVAIIRGCEANLLNTDGDIDLPYDALKHLDWVISSFHEPVFRPSTKQEHTTALINVIRNGKIDALGHLGNPNFDFDFEAVIKVAAQYNVAVEVNNSTLLGHSRVGSVDRCYAIIEIAKQYGAYITTGTDSHFCDSIGKFDHAKTLLDKVGVKPEQVITSSAARFLDFLAIRGRTPIDEFVRHFT